MAARGGWGAASLGRPRTDPIFDSQPPKRVWYNKKAFLHISGGESNQRGREGGVTPYLSPVSWGDSGGTRTRRDGVSGLILKLILIQYVKPVKLARCMPIPFQHRILEHPDPSNSSTLTSMAQSRSLLIRDIAIGSHLLMISLASRLFICSSGNQRPLLLSSSSKHGLRTSQDKNWVLYAMIRVGNTCLGSLRLSALTMASRDSTVLGIAHSRMVSQKGPIGH